MRRYRIIATHEHQMLHCHAEIHAWLLQERTWRWEPITTWTLTTDDPGTVLFDSLVEHGWSVAPEDLPEQFPAVFSVQPHNREAVLQQVTSQIRELTRYQNARDNIIADVPPLHHAGYLSPARLSDLVDCSRSHIYAANHALRDSLTETLGQASPDERPDIIDQLTVAERQHLQRKG